jgi:hypothetical protein
MGHLFKKYFKEEKMKTISASLLILISLFIISCETSTESTVGTTQDTAIPSLSFTVDTTYLNGSAGKLIAKGIVKNNGNTSVSSPWYIEGQFYTNATLSTKLGGNYTQIGVPLSRGQPTFWTIDFSSSNMNVRDYPNFAISDLRGIYK